MALSNLVTPVYNHWCFFLDGQIISFLQKKWRCLKKKKKRHRTSRSHGRKCFIFPECFRGYRLPQRARMKDDLAPCSNSLWLSTSAETITSVSVEEDVPGNNSASFALSRSGFFILLSLIFKVGFSSVSVSRIPSSSLASVCFWHRGASQGVTARWASDVKHVCSLVLWRLNQAEGEGRRLELHL